MLRLILTLSALASAAQGATAVRILLGQGDSAGTDWSGGVTARGATISAVEPWRFDEDDAMLPGNRWKISTHLIRLFGTANFPAGRVAVANGVIVLLDGETEDTQLDVQTPRGVFTLKLNEIPYGKRKPGLDGKAIADRVPPFSCLWPCRPARPRAGSCLPRGPRL